MQYLKFFISASVVLIAIVASFGAHPYVQGTTQGANTTSGWFENGSMETYAIAIHYCGKNYYCYLSVEISDALSNGTYYFTENSSAAQKLSNDTVPQYYNRTMCGPFQAVNCSILSNYSKGNLSTNAYGMNISNKFSGYNYGVACKIISNFTYSTPLGSFKTYNVSTNSNNCNTQSYFDQKSGILVGFVWHSNVDTYFSPSFYANLTLTNVNTTLIPAKPLKPINPIEMPILFLIILSAPTGMAFILLFRSEGRIEN